MTARHQKTRVLLAVRAASCAAACYSSSERRCAAQISKLRAMRVKQNNEFGPIRSPENNDFWRPIAAKLRLPYNSAPTPPTRTPLLSPSLVLVVSTQPSSHHHFTKPRPATPIYIYAYSCSNMDSGSRSSDAPRIEVGSFLVRQRSFVPLRPSGSSRMVEASQLEKAAAARRSILTLAPPGEKLSRVPLLRYEYVLIYG